MSVKKKRLIVVLGMHRSGTSAVARSLQALGVQLGANLMPPMEGVNSKGFWEDLDINAFNIELMNFLGADWHSLCPLEFRSEEEIKENPFFLRAVEIIRRKLDAHTIFGFKDPRVAKLLNFWRVVFQHCEVETDYVLAIRNPLSIVQSLAKRDGFESEKSYLLWLDHVITSLVYSTNGRRVLVDYDNLIASPDLQLKRISQQLNLTISNDGLDEYRTKFLDNDLRHTVFEPVDLKADESCPPLVSEIYSQTIEIAADRLFLENLDFQRKVVGWWSEFKLMKAALRLSDKLYLDKEHQRIQIAESTSRIAFIEKEISERDAVISGLRNDWSRRTDQVFELETKLDKLLDRQEVMSQAILERNENLLKMERLLEGRSQEILSLSELIRSKEEMLATRDAKLQSQSSYIENILKERADVIQRNKDLDAVNALLTAEIVSIKSSLSMRLTTPLRYLRNLFRKTKFK